FASQSSVESSLRRVVVYVADRLERRRPPSRANETERQPTSDTLTRAARAPRGCRQRVGAQVYPHVGHRVVHSLIHRLNHRTAGHICGTNVKPPACCHPPSPCEWRPTGGFDAPTLGGSSQRVNATSLLETSACGRGCGRGGDAQECSCGQGGTGLCMRTASARRRPSRPARMAVTAVDGKETGGCMPARTTRVHACTDTGACLHRHGCSVWTVSCRCRTPAVRCPRGCFGGLSARGFSRGPAKRAPSSNGVGVSRRRSHDRAAAGANVTRRRA